MATAKNNASADARKKTEIKITADFPAELKSYISDNAPQKNQDKHCHNIYLRTDETLTVYVDDKKITLKPRSQELLAYLLTAMGRIVPNTELVRNVLKREPDDASMMALRVNWFNLKQELKEYGIDYIVCSTRTGRGRYLDITAVTSDLQQMLSGDKARLSALYINNYLFCYDWAAPMRHKLVRIAMTNLRQAA